MAVKTTKQAGRAARTANVTPTAPERKPGKRQAATRASAPVIDYVGLIRAASVKADGSIKVSFKSAINACRSKLGLATGDILSRDHIDALRQAERHLLQSSLLEAKEERFVSSRVKRQYVAAHGAVMDKRTIDTGAELPVADQLRFLRSQAHDAAMNAKESAKAWVAASTVSERQGHAENFSKFSKRVRSANKRGAQIAANNGGTFLPVSEPDWSALTWDESASEKRQSGNETVAKRKPLKSTSEESGKGQPTPETA